MSGESKILFIQEVPWTAADALGATPEGFTDPAAPDGKMDMDGHQVIDARDAV